MVHSKDTLLWSGGRLATKGLEDVAEIGNITNLNFELDAIIAKRKGLSRFSIPPPPVTGSTAIDLTFNTNYTRLSFASMIAPSPDRFLGVHDIDLFQSRKWINDTTINILVYDAGTEEGDVFSYENPATSPQQNISLLTPTNASVLANGNPEIYAIGTLRLQKK